MDLIQIGKLLVLVGSFILFAGIFILVLHRFMPSLGKLPGDILIRKDNFTFYFPVVTSIIISVLLTLILNFIFSGK